MDMTVLNKTLKTYFDMMLGTNLNKYKFSTQDGLAKVEEIITATSKITGVAIMDIMSRRRDPKIIHARHIAMFLVYELTTLSYVSIGRAMDRDHTSIMYAIKKLNNRGRGKSKINTDMVKIKKLLAA